MKKIFWILIIIVVIFLFPASIKSGIISWNSTSNSLAGILWQTTFDDDGNVTMNLTWHDTIYQQDGILLTGVDTGEGSYGIKIRPKRNISLVNLTKMSNETDWSKFNELTLTNQSGDVLIKLTGVTENDLIIDVSPDTPYGKNIYLPNANELVSGKNYSIKGYTTGTPLTHPATGATFPEDGEYYETVAGWIGSIINYDFITVIANISFKLQTYPEMGNITLTNCPSGNDTSSRFNFDIPSWEIWNNYSGVDVVFEARGNNDNSTGTWIPINLNEDSGIDNFSCIHIRGNFTSNLTDTALLSNLNITFSNNDTLTPNINISQPTGTKSTQTVTATFNISDDVEISYCYYNVTSASGTPVTNTEISNCSFNTTLEVVTGVWSSDLKFAIWSNDSSNNINHTFITFTTSQPSSNGQIPGGGGGGTPREILVLPENATNFTLSPKVLDIPYLPISLFWNKNATFKYLIKSDWEIKDAEIITGEKTSLEVGNTTLLIKYPVFRGNFFGMVSKGEIRATDIYGRVDYMNYVIRIFNPFYVLIILGVVFGLVIFFVFKPKKAKLLNIPKSFNKLIRGVKLWTKKTFS